MTSRAPEARSTAEDPGPEPPDHIDGGSKWIIGTAQPGLDRVTAGELRAPEAIDLDEPQGPIAAAMRSYPRAGVELAEGGGDVLEPVGCDELEVAERVHRGRRDERDVLLEQREPVDEPPMDVLGGLAGAVRGGVAEHDRLAGVDPLGERVAVGVGLPAPCG